MIKSKQLSTLFLVSICITIFFNQVVNSQSYILNNETSFLEVHGTSSLHDWHVDAQSQKGLAKISVIGGIELKTLNFSVISESLKSGKNSMDKNTYKALKTDDFKTIDFKLTKIKNVDQLTENSFNISAIGDITITGVTKSIPIDFTFKLKDNQILVGGEKSLKMTDFGIEPPKALFGTIKTGDMINVVFKAVYITKNLK